MADLAELRRAARRILDAAIAAGDADRLTRQALAREGSRLRVGGRDFDLARVRRVVVVGAGKASGTMAEAAEAVLDGVPLEGLVVVKERHRRRGPGASAWSRRVTRSRTRAARPRRRRSSASRGTPGPTTSSCA